MNVERTAGDLLIQKADEFVEHVQACDLDDCRVCAARFNQLRLAHAVWRRSRHRTVGVFAIMGADPEH